MLDFLRLSLISALITTAAGIVMWYFSRYDFAFNEIYNEGLNLYKRQKYKQAMNKFKLAIEKFPNKCQAHYNLGLCALELENYNQAKESFLQALNLNQDDSDTIYNLGYIEMKLGNYGDAREYFKKILEINPLESETLFNMGYIEAMENDYKKAKEYISKTIEANPNKTEYKNFYIEVLDALYNQLGSPQILQEMLNIALELFALSNDDEDLLYKIAVIYAKMGDWDNSASYCSELYKKNPNSYRACNQYGLTLFCKGETKKAIEMYEQAIKLKPEIPDSYLNLVFAYNKIGKKVKAKNLAEDFMKKFPDNPLIEMAQDYLNRRDDDQFSPVENSLDSMAALQESMTENMNMDINNTNQEEQN